MKKNLRAYSIYQAEVKKLVNFYKINASFFKNTVTKKHLKSEETNKESKAINSLLDFNVNFNVGNRGNRLGLVFTLRELIYVRLISALEVFLVDSVKDIYTLTRIPFRVNKKHTFYQSELLSLTSISEIRTKIIQKETRELSSGGYGIIEGYYKKRFNINLSEILPGKNKIEKYHQIRHLLVHRLGKTDTQFREKYNYNKKGISISEELLIDTFNDFNGFVEEIHLRLKKAIDNYVNEDTKSDNQDISTFTFKSKLELDSIVFITAHFEFWTMDELHIFQDLKSKVIPSEKGKEVIMVHLWGKNNLILEYLQKVKSLIKKSNDYWAFKVVGYPKPKKLKKRLDESIIELVKAKLPEKPWKQGIHKDIAKELDLPNGKVSKAIRILIKREDDNEE